MLLFAPVPRLKLLTRLPSGFSRAMRPQLVPPMFVNAPAISNLPSDCSAMAATELFGPAPGSNVEFTSPACGCARLGKGNVSSPKQTKVIWPMVLWTFVFTPDHAKSQGESCQGEARFFTEMESSSFFCQAAACSGL